MLYSDSAIRIHLKCFSQPDLDVIYVESWRDTQKEVNLRSRE